MPHRTEPSTPLDCPDRSHRELASGMVHVFTADFLMVPTGLLTVAFLTRQFGPEGYGLFALAASLVAGIEWGLSSLLSRLTVHAVSETRKWEPVAASMLRWQFALGGIAMLLLWLAAAPLAALLDEPALATYLTLFAVDIPLFLLAQAHRNILTGLGHFHARAMAGAGRWMTRLLLIVILVECGLSIPGAIAGTMGASVVELLIARFYVRPGFTMRAALSDQPLCQAALPLVLSAVALSCFTKLDLFALKMLGGSAAQAGVYAAAQNLAILPGIFAHAFSPLLLSTVNRAIRQGDVAQARALGRHAIRLVFILFPFVGLLAGAAPHIVLWAFGPSFASASIPMVILIIGAAALALIAVTTAILTAAGRTSWVFGLTGPLVPAAIGGHLLMIPTFGLHGAAIVTSGLSIMCAGATLAAVSRLWTVLPTAGTMWRSVLLFTVAYALAGWWATPDADLLVELPALGLCIVMGQWVLGEITIREKAFCRSLMSWGTRRIRDVEERPA